MENTVLATGSRVWVTAPWSRPQALETHQRLFLVFSVVSCSTVVLFQKKWLGACYRFFWVELWGVPPRRAKLESIGLGWNWSTSVHFLRNVSVLSNVVECQQEVKFVSCTIELPSVNEKALKNHARAWILLSAYHFIEHRPRSCLFCCPWRLRCLLGSRLSTENVVNWQ